MKFQPVSSHHSTLLNELFTPAPKLQKGQIINAQVLSRINLNLFDLLINNQKLKASIKEPLEPGQKVKLVVEETSDPPVLRAIKTAQQGPEPSNKLTALLAIRDQFLRQALPQQASMRPLVKTLTQFFNKPDAHPAFSSELKQVLKSLLQNFSSADVVSNKTGLKQSLQNSGLFLEAKLLGSSVPDSTNKLAGQSIAGDNKSLMLKIANILDARIKNLTNQISNQESKTPVTPVNQPRQANRTAALPSPLTNPNPVMTASTTATQIKHIPQRSSPEVVPQNASPQQTQSATPSQALPELKELLQQIEQSLNRIQLNQNNAIVVEKQELPVWTMDIPVKDGKDIDLLNVSIYKDANAASEEASELWHIQLEFDFEPLGLIRSKISLYNDEITTAIWAEETQTRQLIRAHVGDLKIQMRESGLNISSVQCLDSELPVRESPQTGKKLVDLHL